MMKRLPVALFVVFLLLLGLQSVLVTPAYASMNKGSKITPTLADNLNSGLPATGGNATLQASFNKAFLQGNGVLSGLLYAMRIINSSPNLMDKKSPDQVAIDLTGAGQVNLAEPIIFRVSCMIYRPATESQTKLSHFRLME